MGQADSRDGVPSEDGRGDNDSEKTDPAPHSEKMSQLVVDADSHVLEPKDLWQTYIEPRFLDRAPRIEVDSDGWEQWVIDGKPYSYRHGVFGDMGAIGKDLKRYFTPGAVTYEEGCRLSPGGWDPRERVKVLDEESIDKVLLYPSLGITWEGGCDDPELAAACCRAYNTWLIEWCIDYPDRLYPVAHASLKDPVQAALELKRTAEAGVRGAMVRAYPSGDRPYGHPDNDPFWTAAQDLNLPVALHIGGNPKMAGSDLFDVKFGAGTWWVYVMFAADTFIGLTSLFHGAVFERFPGLKTAALETGSAWVGYWLERMDETFENLKFSIPLKQRPSDYFKRQCWVTMEPDEELAITTIRHVGADNFMWAADYPHSDGQLDAVAKLKSTIEGLSTADQGKILGGNAERVYNLR